MTVWVIPCHACFVFAGSLSAAYLLGVLETTWSSPTSTCQAMRSWTILAFLSLTGLPSLSAPRTVCMCARALVRSCAQRSLLQEPGIPNHHGLEILICTSRPVVAVMPSRNLNEAMWFHGDLDGWYNQDDHIAVRLPNSPTIFIFWSHRLAQSQASQSRRILQYKRRLRSDYAQLHIKRHDYSWIVH